jgi:four helix bundle protein
MTNVESGKKYDLEERTAKFGEEVIEFCRVLQKDVITIPIVGQLISSATSVGANYCEADCAESKKDFEHKIGIANKEAKESKHWLRMIGKAVPEYVGKARILWKEAHELNLILTTIVKNSRSK